MRESRESFFEATLKRCATMLARWQGTTELREITVSHKTLRIVLTSAGRPGNLVLSCIDPRHLRCPILWEHSDLVVSRAVLVPDDEGFAVTDSNDEVELLCGGIEVAENVKLY